MKEVFSVLFLLGPSMAFGFMGKTTEMGLAIIAGGLASAFLNLDKLQEFKGGGLEIKLREAVNEAYVTIENLKSVSKPLLIATLNLLIYGNRWGGIGKKKNHDIWEMVNSTINSLDIQSDGEVEVARKAYISLNTRDLYQQFTLSIQDAELRKKLDQIFDLGKSVFPKENNVDNIVKITELSPDSKEKLNDYIYFLNNQKYRHETSDY